MAGNKRRVENSPPLAVGPWTSHLASLCLVPIRKVRTIMSTSAAAAAAAAAKSLQPCRTLCDPIDGSPPGSPVPGILQARTLVVNSVQKGIRTVVLMETLKYN